MTQKVFSFSFNHNDDQHNQNDDNAKLQMCGEAEGRKEKKETNFVTRIPHVVGPLLPAAPMPTSSHSSPLSRLLLPIITTKAPTITLLSTSSR